MSLQEESLRARIATGWTLMLLVLISMLVTMIIQSSFMNDNFQLLAHDPAPKGMKMLMYVMGIYALMPVYVSVVQSWRIAGLRWVVVVVAGLSLLHFILHHVAHWVRGDRPDFGSHILDISHHVLALWVLVNSIRWARLAAAPAVKLADAPAH